VEVWQTSSLRPLRLGEEIQKEEEEERRRRIKKKPQNENIMSASATQAAIKYCYAGIAYLIPT